MRKTLAALLSISLVLPHAGALPIRYFKQPEKEPEPPKATPVKSAGLSYFERLFSTGNRPAPTRAPVPKAGAKPLPMPQPVVKPAAKPKTRRPAPSVAVGPKEVAPAKEKVAPPKEEPATASPAQATPPAPAKAAAVAKKDDQLPPPPKGKGTKSKTVAKKAATPSAKLDLTGMDEVAKFKAVKAHAMEDAEVKDLKTKAESEVDDSAAQKALVAYNRALFRKIREIEPSVTAYSERVEASMTKRLGAEQSRP